MKICFIVQDIFSVGGIQRVVSVLANELVKKNQVDILCISHNKNEDRSLYNLNEKINVVIDDSFLKRRIINKFPSKVLRKLNNRFNFLNNIRSVNILRYAYYPKEVLNRFESYINTNNYDVVIGVANEYSLLLSIIAKRVNCRTIGWQHSSYDAYFNTKGAYSYHQEELYKKYMNNLDQLIVLTNYDKSMYETKLNISTKVIYNPITIKCDKKSKLDNKVILFAGRLEESKGVDLLLKTFAIVHRRRPDWKLYIAGDGSKKDEIIESIREKNLDDYVSMLGNIKDMMKQYCSSSIFVSSSRWEGFGLSLIEAMGCGVPVVSFANSGPNEIIDDNWKNGILIEKYDIDNFADAIIRLIDDKKLRELIGSESIKRAEEFLINNILTEWYSIF
ncbi:glycosyltransferase [Inconstantimicrobium porci]|uniref:Glycosyltransferase family 4 protein n=1 Tax=Inconstantimicrobium porci TaxID=2652291 RepID=A0A7X2MY47_9CLOT|nr:glycosyltransferase [Inconstantimicrobium porci]MSR91208.1 glycosyltransferase family 4 protein [Inconstantimicrobium porci]